MAFGLESVQLNLLTNATLFHKKRVQAGLHELWALGGTVWAKLDAGTEGWFQRVDGTKLSFQRILDNLSWAAQQQPIVLQCMFHRFGDLGPSDLEISAWTDRIADIVNSGGKIKQIQVYSVARKPADSTVMPLGSVRLNAIAEAARAKLDFCDSPTEVCVY